MKVALCLAMAGILTSSCVGSFAMFNKLASWNKTATDNKFLNELIFIVISSSGQATTRWLAAWAKQSTYRVRTDSSMP